MKILLIDNGTNFLHKLDKLVPGHQIIKKFNSRDVEDIDPFDLIVLSGGGKHNVEYEHKLFEKEQKVIHSGKSVIGICFGCELIAYTFGGTLKKLDVAQKGIYEIKIDSEELGGPRVIEVYEGHSWGIDKLPDDFEVLAESFSGPEIIRHASKPIYGIQFHPENMVKETEGDELFKKILESLNLK